MRVASYQTFQGKIKIPLLYFGAVMTMWSFFKRQQHQQRQQTDKQTEYIAQPEADIWEADQQVWREVSQEEFHNYHIGEIRTEWVDEDVSQVIAKSSEYKPRFVLRFM